MLVPGFVCELLNSLLVLDRGKHEQSSSAEIQVSSVRLCLPSHLLHVLG